MANKKKELVKEEAVEVTAEVVAEKAEVKDEGQTFEKVAETCEKDANEKLKVVTTALHNGDLTAYGLGMAELKKSVATLNQALCNVQYSKFMETPNPIITAVKTFYIEVFKIKEERSKEDDSLVGVALVKKKARIDLEKLCDFGRLDKTWAYDSSKLLALLTLRETDVYAIKPSELVKKSYYFIGAVHKKQDGETPDSNTKIVALLQKIIDEAIFVDNGSGKNKYKCNNHDICFIQDAVTKIDTKEKCTIAMLNERQFKTVMMSVFAHCLGENYKVKAAKIKANA